MDYFKCLNDIPQKYKEPITIQIPGVKKDGKLIMGYGLASKIGEEVIKFAAKNVLIVTDKTIIGLELHEIIVKSIAKKNISLVIFDEIDPEPHIETVKKIQKIVRENKYDVIIGLGGGSSLDIAKSASMVATNPLDIEEYLNGQVFENIGIPTILVPTTSGTGSEVSPYIVLSKGDKKLFIGNQLAYATIALVDPLLTVTMPARITASTGLDALSHGVEGMISKTNPYTIGLGIQCVELVFKYLKRAYDDAFDYEARYYMSFASVMGMLAYSQGGGLYAHSISYILTLKIKLPHGIGCGLALPYTLDFNMNYIQDILDRFGDVLCKEIPCREKRRKETVNKFYGLLESLNMPKSMSELGIKESSISEMAEELFEKYYRVSNPRELTINESNHLIKKFFFGKRNIYDGIAE